MPILVDIGFKQYLIYFRLVLRVDGLNKLTNTVFELKPYNIRNARKGVKQILNYNDALGGGYKMIIVLY